MKKVHNALTQLRVKHRLSQRPLTFLDFKRICHSEEITLQIMDLRVSGFFYRIKGRGPYIAIDEKLKPKQLLHVAFHELGHYLMHKPDRGIARSRNRKEREANLFADLATT